jgi:putative redox protein
MVKTKSTQNDFHCELTNEKMMIDSDAPIFKGGQGNGFRPHELLESALATCINISIRMIAKKSNINIDKVETQVEVEKTDEKTTFKYKIVLDDKLNEKDKDFFMNIIDQCAVKQTLTKQLEFVQEF